jgi:SecD/SecF fusion protein
MSDRQRHGFVLLLVVGLIAASIFVLTTQKTVLGLDLKGGIELVYQGEPTPRTPVVTQAALQRAVDIMRSRVDQLGVSEPSIQTTGHSLITVGLPDIHDVTRAENEVGQTAQLFFYDWEANVLTPAGKPAAAGLLTQDPNSTTLSTGGATGQPGVPGGGGMSLYQAVTLAAKQPPAPLAKPSSQTTQSRKGPAYYLFGAPGSAACAAAAKAAGTTPVQGQHCLLNGPDPTTTSLYQGLPPRVTKAEGQLLTVPQGTVVLQAANPSATDQVKASSPNAQFYVLKDDVALTGDDITNPQASTDQTGAPDVTFSFTGAGQTNFSRVTATIAHRGSNVSIGGAQLKQHFAVALDGQLITVPQIDFHQYPDGITGGGGADITGGFTSQTASDLANQLRLGALPITLKRISEEEISATLGAQALHQGLIAGAVGLGIVALFLLAYYRVLGVIAVAGLAVYGLYFYALIKLIPITLSLAGIAGLILTIGVAADANIVIFERVKEEIRAGRSIRAGIATGYKKGLTAIIDANVVTIMTAFILFVLATSDVKGFAFTLGIGVIVSLFTAVLATQAILMTMGDSRTIARPSALGAGGKKHAWTYDFMGASKYFFSLSGVILLIGALAIGGRGLNLGIDFTSGSRINITVANHTTSSAIQSVVAGAGVKSPVVQEVGSRGTQFQVSAKPLSVGSGGVQQALTSKYGKLKLFQATTVGPTFGQTVANSAVIAIIASLLVISAYVALRFDWKFAIPVLIALMHDLLITSGVYALTGREVTVDTVAALLTILGYSLYDTIIVFDRVRENIPRMPRAAFSQIVNRSMSEVLTRSLATTSCTLLPILALLLFGGSTLKDFAFALLIGVASGAYSSIFIASPVLTHWKERESVYRHRRERIEADYGVVAPYASAGADVDPARDRVRRRAGRITEPEAEGVSAAEFEQMKRDIAEEEAEPRRRTSTLTKRLAHTPEGEDGGSGSGSGRAKRSGGNGGAGGRAGGGRAGGAGGRAGGAGGRGGRAGQPQGGAPGGAPVPPPTPPPSATPPVDQDRLDEPLAGEDFEHAPDEAEEGGIARTPKPSDRSPKPRRANRRHGRRR